MRRNETGSNNTALGVKALYFNTTASQNTAIGSVALFYNTDGYQNTALGANALLNNETGDRNSAVGEGALKNTTTGSFNTAVGWAAGYSLSTGSNNVFVGRGANGGAADSGTIRIGGSDLQSQTFIEGVSGTNVSGVNVLITAGDQLGVAASSARFKQDIHDLEGVSDQLMDLRPVSFRYKDEYASEGLKSIEYGLIAEEVAEIFPELVVGDANGKPYTVRYQLLTPLLLAEVQRQQDVLDDQRQQLTDLRRRLRLLESKQRFR